MKQMIRKIERSNKKATKFKFRIEPQQMTIETDDKWCPDQVFLVCQHRNKRFTSRPRKLESSCTIACRRLVVWPESMSDPIEFETTLYNANSDPNNHEDKTWTIVLEGSMTKLRGEKARLKRRPLASTELNMKTLISQPGMKAEVNVVMRPLQDGIKFCRLEMFLITVRSTEDESFGTQVIPDSNQFYPNTSSSCAVSPQALIMQQTDQADTHQIMSQPKQFIPTSTHATQQLISTNGSIGQQQSVNVSIGMPVTAVSIPLSNVHISSEGTLTSANSNTTTQIQPMRQRKPLKIVNPDSGEYLNFGPDTKNATSVAPSVASDEETKSTVVKTDFYRKVAEAANQSGALQQNNSPSSFCGMRNNGDMNLSLLEQQRQHHTKGSIPIIQKEAPVTTTEFTETNQTPKQYLLHKITTPFSATNFSQPVSIEQPTMPIIQHSDSLLEKARNINLELLQIKQEMEEIEQQDQLVKSKIPDFETGSEQERELIEHHHRLVGEKDQLSRRQDYLNVQSELNETDFKILHLRKRLTATVSSNEKNLSNEEVDCEAILMNGRRDSNTLLIELKELMDLKDELTHKLSDLEAEDEEGVERSRLILEQTRNQNLNFRRGVQEPLNVSKRLMGWLNGMEQRFKQ